MPRNYYMPRWAAVIIAVIVILFLISALTSCYTRGKAQKQFARSAVTFPEIPADYCARTYPARDSFIQGKDIVKTDTLWGDGEVTFIRDTIRNRDTVFINTIKQMPGTVIRETVLRTDTVYKENTAALDLSRIQLGNALAIATDKTKEADKWKRIAKKRFWVILGMGAAIAIGIVAMIRRKVVKKIPL